MAQITLPGFEEQTVELPPLKAHHEAFCRAYVLNGGDGKAAYLSVSPDTKPDSAKTIACNLLKKPAITEYVSAFRINMRSVLERRVINYQQTVLELDRLDFLEIDDRGNLKMKSLNDLTPEQRSITEFEQVSSKDGVRTLVSLPKKQQASESLIKILGLNKETLSISGDMRVDAVVDVASDGERFDNLRRKMKLLKDKER